MSIDRYSLIVLLSVAGCAESRQPDPTPANDSGGYNLVDPVPTAVEDAQRIAQGEWSRRAGDGRRGIQFAPPDGEPLFAMLCDERDGLVLERRGVTPTGETGMMELSFEGAHGSYAVDELQSGEPALRASIPFADDMLTRLRGLDGPVSVNVDRGRPLVMPATPLIPELIAACERAEEDVRTAD